jgi:hypothetical protein
VRGLWIGLRCRRGGRLWCHGLAICCEVGELAGGVCRCLRALTYYMDPNLPAPMMPTWIGLPVASSWASFVERLVIVMCVFGSGTQSRLSGVVKAVVVRLDLKASIASCRWRRV